MAEKKEKLISVSKDGRMKQVVVHTVVNGKNRKGKPRVNSQTKHVSNT